MASHNRTTASEINLKVVDIPTVPTIGTAGVVYVLRGF
jgi:hypothetical protein